MPIPRRRDGKDSPWAKTQDGREVEIHVASFNLQKNYAKISHDPADQRENRHACDSDELGKRAADHLREENYGRPLDRR